MAEIHDNVSCYPCKHAIEIQGNFADAATQGIIYHMPIFEKYIRKSLLTSVEDGISYVEPRINFLARYNFPLTLIKLLAYS